MYRMVLTEAVKVALAPEEAETVLLVLEYQ